MAANGLLILITSVWLSLWYLTRPIVSVRKSVIDVEIPVDSRISIPSNTITSVATAHGVGLPAVGNAAPIPVSVVTNTQISPKLTLVPTSLPAPEHGVMVTDPKTGNQVIRSMNL